MHSGFSKGWKEAFMSGDQEPWVFRGGLTADLQRLIPIDNGNDLLAYKLPTSPTSELYNIRPFIESDREQVILDIDSNQFTYIDICVFIFHINF